MFNRIVVGTDGSETATEAVRTAVELAKLSKAKLEIVSAYEPVPRSRLQEEAEGISGDVSYAINPREDVQLVLDNAAAEAKKAKVDVVTHPREGDPADAILDVAEENDADLVLVRPDQHVAWRGAAVDRPETLLSTVVGAADGPDIVTPVPTPLEEISR